MASEIAVLCVFQYEYEALLAQADLDAVEIPSSLLTDTWSEVAVVPQYRLTVHQRDVERARACLAEAAAERERTARRMPGA